MTGKNKEINYPILKAIRITETQAKAWNPDRIRAFLEDSLPYDIKKEIDYIHQPLYNISSKNKITTELSKTCENIIKNTNLLKLETYSEATKGYCIEMMEELFHFLQKQLDNKRKVVDITLK